MRLLFNTIRSNSVFYLAIILLSVGQLLISCTNPKQEQNSVSETISPESFVVHPDWSKNANIYEVNIRQYTPEGTFKAFQDHLPRLKKMGVDILWLMPIFPIGEKNRKGSLGSYYSVKDYKAVNPEFGTMDDFKDMVQNAHEMGFKVILDWVANHSAWDNLIIFDHPEWYTKDDSGNMVSPFDWTDVVDLNYENDDLHQYMVEALKFWIIEADIDGYRCDVAGMVPTDFWNDARKELDKIKPVFMLAEAEQVDLHINAFDMTYAWELHHIFNEIAKGNKNANDIETYFEKADTLYPKNAYRMNFITNHDENSWNGTVAERMGRGWGAFAILSYTLPGMPLIYSGQEVGLNKRLKFFEKDEIDWSPNIALNAIYTKLNTLKSENEALWNGEFGGDFNRINSTNDDFVFAFTREKGKNKVLVITNLSTEYITTTLTGSDIEGEYTDVFTVEKTVIKDNATFELEAGDFKVLVLNH